MKAKNEKKAGKLSFKFSEENHSKKKDRTNETLAMLAKLDSLATVSSTKIVEHNFSKKRQKKIHADDEMTDDAAGSLLFSEEELDRLSKEYFLHSKAEKPKHDTWKD